jgi:hypothetical protein
MTLDLEMRDLTPIELDQASGGLDPLSVLVGGAMTLAVIFVSMHESSGWMNDERSGQEREIDWEGHSLCDLSP